MKEAINTLIWWTAQKLEFFGYWLVGRCEHVQRWRCRKFEKPRKTNLKPVCMSMLNMFGEVFARPDIQQKITEIAGTPSPFHRNYKHYLKYGTFHLTKEEIEKGIENPNKYIHDYFKEVFARGIKSVEDFKLFEEE